MINAERIRRSVVVIGASQGGVEALISLVVALPAGIPAALGVVVHIHPLHESRLPWILSRRASIKVVHAEHFKPFEHATAYIAPPDLHMRLSDGVILLDRGPKVHRTRPAVDPLFVSAAEAYGASVVGVLLSGGGDDGLAGLLAIKARGGICLVQDPREAGQPSMPLAALQHDHVDGVYSIDRLGRALGYLAAGESVKDGAPPPPHAS